MMYCSHTYTGELGETTFSKYTPHIIVNRLLAVSMSDFISPSSRALL